MNKPIKIAVNTTYIEQQSDPEDDRYVFAYTITITNLSDTPVTLRKRRWVIVDSHQKVQEIQGDGVVGKQPRLAPGTQFEYTSGAVLDTPVNTMEGEYTLETDQGEVFLAPIERFTLAIPRTLH